MSVPDTAYLDLIARHPGLAQHALAGALGVTTRTARRRLSALVRAGLVEAERCGAERRYRLVPGAQPELPVPQLTEQQAEALTLAALAAEALLRPTPYGAPLRSAREALCRTWLDSVFAFEPDEEAEHWDFEGVAGGELPREGFALLRPLVQAIRDRRPVHAVYLTARTRTRSERTLHPLGVFVRAGSWLVAAWCPRSRCVKDFALGGFESADVDETDTFEPPPGFSLALHVRDRFGAMSGDEPCEVRLLAEPSVAESFRRKQHHPTQQLEPAEGGRVEVSLEVLGLEGVTPWVLSYGAKVRVLAPPALAERVAEAHRAAAALYPLLP
ncbi:MAG: helix-turn-helix transcriptional regulator [Rubricoccaceae bacterium]